MSFNSNDNHGPVVQIGRFEINSQDFNADPQPDDLPIIATRNLVLFPGVTIPISLTREASLKVANIASEERIPVGIVCQTDPDQESPSVTGGLCRYGVIADVYQVIELPDGSHTALVHGRDRIRILGRGAGTRIPGELSARVKILTDTEAADKAEFDATVERITQLSSEIVASQQGDQSFSTFIKGMDDPVQRLHFVATNFPIDTAGKIKLLGIGDLQKRSLEFLAMLMTDRERLSVAQDILEKAGQRMKDNQRSTYLQMQLDTIKEELYGSTDDEDDFESLERRARAAGFPKNVAEIFSKEVGKLRRLNPTTPDYSVQYAYLETLLELPWNKQTKTSSDIDYARRVLEDDHYGLEKIKQRILEQIAVVLNNPQAKAPILCLVGPPGVGKTSLGRSIARAMGRKYQRVSLGGLHDEAEIRGHRRTYIGAMPGRIVKAMKNAGTTNPILLLDEIDKLGQDYKGDPSSALLEVLDPEQNIAFHDNYIDIDYNLSGVLFIATANSLSSIAAPLLDRMEIISLSGYLPEEKIEIARRHLLPKVIETNGLKGELPFGLPDETINALIDNYTAESGVRQLEKQLASIVRKYILATLSKESFPATVRPEDLRPMLGLPLYTKEKYEGNDFTGVVTGLAWTQVGGEILLAEASLSPGKGDRLTITGNLGDVMKESATIALQWVKANSAAIGIDTSRFEQNNLHVHFPEGAIPKDGPSAGITIATAIVSAFTGRKVAERIAMTGEITLRGKVLPVGGIKEKILAAKRAGIDTIILSSENRRDIEDIDRAYREGLSFVYVDTMSDVIARAIL